MQTKPITENNGKYKWTYEMSLFKNPHIFLLVAKVLLGTILGVSVFLWLIAGIADGFSMEGLRFAGKLLLILLAIFAGLLILGYLLYAAIMGGKYIVDFTMDDAELVHAQSARQAKKAKGIAAATAVAGLLSRNVTTVGVGVSAARTVSSTEFARVKKVVANRRTGIIRLRGGGSNEVFADGADFDFVAEFIRAHIPSTAVWVEK